MRAVVAIIFVAGVDLDPNRKNEPHVSISTCDIKTTFAIKATDKKRQIHEIWKKLSRHTSFGECLLSLGVELDPTW